MAKLTRLSCQLIYPPPRTGTQAHWPGCRQPFFTATFRRPCPPAQPSLTLPPTCPDLFLGKLAILGDLRLSPVPEGGSALPSFASPPSGSLSRGRQHGPPATDCPLKRVSTCLPGPQTPSRDQPCFFSCPAQLRRLRMNHRGLYCLPVSALRGGPGGTSTQLPEQDLVTASRPK